MTATIALSQTVKSAVNRLTNKQAIPATKLAFEVLKDHDDYVPASNRKIKAALQQTPDENNDTSSLKSASPPETVLHVEAWIDNIQELYYISKLEVLHGRTLLIGLSLIDHSVRNILMQEKFLSKLIDEVREKPKDILSEKGWRLYQSEIHKEQANKGYSDYVKTQPDNPLLKKEDDKLDRAAFATFLTRLLHHTDLKSGAYSLHIYAPWGGGKTSVLQFMKLNLAEQKTPEGKPRWHAIDFNAWQNQHISYPWWTLMNVIFKKTKSFLPFKYRLKEWGWRFSSSNLHYLIALAVIIWIIFLFIVPQVQKTSGSIPETAGKVFEYIGKLVAGIISVWALVEGISKYAFIGSKKAAEGYIASRTDPMNAFKEQFLKLTKALSPANLIIFIDDLDRCKPSYVVDLLENIQTLFKEANVVFVIAADKKWIHACYEVEYEKIKNYIGVEGKGIGPLFVEKMFQMSIALPAVHPEVKEKFWRSIIGATEAEEILKASGLINEIGDVANVEDREKIIHKAEEQSFEVNHAIRLQLLDTLADKRSLENTENLLVPYSRLLDLNPRGMKRLLNSYSVNKATSIISHLDIEPHQLVLWTILNMRWPNLADFLTGANGHVPDKIPADIKALLEDEEVKTVIYDNKIGHSLTKDTIKKCAMLSL